MATKRNRTHRPSDTNISSRTNLLIKRRRVGKKGHIEQIEQLDQVGQASQS